MAGEGSNSKVGLKTETTPGTAVEPDTAIPFTQCSFTAPKALLDSATIVSGTPAKSKGVSSVFAAAGSIGMEVDCETIGQLIYYANGANGKSVAEFGAAAKITTAPTHSAGGTGATLPAGAYYYRVAAVLVQTLTGLKCIMPGSSPTATACTVTLGQEATISFTDPTTLTMPTGFTYSGTIIYRGTVGGANTTTRFLAYQSGSAATYVDDGTDTYRDLNVTYVPATTYYKHTFVAAAASSGQPRLKSFTTQISKNVTDDERFAGSMVSDMSIEVGGADAIVTASFNCQALGVTPVTGEFSASAPTVRKPIPGHQTSAIINDTLSCEVQSFSFNLNNDLSPVYGLCNTPFARKLTTNTSRTASGSVTLTYEDQDLWAKAVNDESISLGIKMWGEPMGLASGGSLSEGLHGVKAFPFPRMMDIDMESCTISDFSNPIDGPGQIVASMNYNADYDSASTTEVTIVLINTTASYS
jgi:hypothetical protein